MSDEELLANYQALVDGAVWTLDEVQKTAQGDARLTRIVNQITPPQTTPATPPRGRRAAS